jgi:hypothetical protein
MRKIYPKLIATLFLILSVAMVLKYAIADSHSTDPTKTAQISKDMH